MIKKGKYTHSIKTKLKIGKAIKGNTPWNKGMKMTEKFCKKVSDTKKSRKYIPWNKGMEMSNKFCKKVSKSRRSKECIPWNKGMKMPKEFGEKVSESNKGRTAWNKGKIGWLQLSEEALKKLRESAIKRIEEQSFNGLPMMPSVGKYETQILDLIEETIGYPIIRQYKVCGYFIDGYCPDYSLAIEVDEPHHNGNKEKDKLREDNIKREINCKFVRIEVPTRYIPAPSMCQENNQLKGEIK